MYMLRELGEFGCLAEAGRVTVHKPDSLVKALHSQQSARRGDCFLKIGTELLHVTAGIIQNNAQFLVVEFLEGGLE